MTRRGAGIRAVLRQARQELTVGELIGEMVVLPFLICVMLGCLVIAQVMLGG